MSKLELDKAQEECNDCQDTGAASPERAGEEEKGKGVVKKTVAMESSREPPPSSEQSPASPVPTTGESVPSTGSEDKEESK